MADISKEDLKKEITAILKGADLSATSSKKVRQELEKKLNCDLTSRKREIDEMVLKCMKTSDKGGKKAGGKKNGKDDEDDDEKDEEEEEDKDDDDKEEDEEEDEDDEEEKKPKRAAPKKQAPPKRKKTSSDESDDASEDKESDEEYSPSKKSKGAKGKAKAAKGRKKKGSDSDSDEDWCKGKKPAAKKGGAKKRGGYNKTCTLTPELAAVVGQDQMARHEVVRKVWKIIKEENLYDPKNKQFAICNDDLFKVIGTKRFRTFGMMKYLKKHFVD